ncbi:helix-turn-helix domain-containing protein [Gordonia sp. HY442]|uniref:PucR family transcriptional regulator n=1 Tax=Gordonia zhenghanii TaxID=2911516 RepID=UPI001F383D18|nr:helix-turn-helix domain-containing protein [Gordonia zhenghanii]MCF8608220.1 helix-turn-helix domain-containing protein [Gordonia zhenghanii]
MRDAKPDEDDLQERVAARVQEVARTIGVRLTETATALHLELAESIPELRGDPMILELLRASTESNVATFLHLAQHSLAVTDVAPPAAATAYAQRLAQRGTSIAALTQAYRFGQRRILDVAFEEIPRQESDPDVAYGAMRMMHDIGFTYVEGVSAQVIKEYDAERDRWLANRNRVRETTLRTLLRSNDVGVAEAESALGYRLWGRHLGVVVWDEAGGNTTTALRRLEAAVGTIAERVGATGQPLFIPQDRSVGWAWIPCGSSGNDVDTAELRGVAVEDDALRVALGTVRSSAAGFRDTHWEAIRAQTVANLAGGSADAVTTYAEPGVRSAALLASDVPAARAMVSSVLGDLAVDDEATARLRETLLCFLAEGGSYQAVARKLFIHRNTVKYRVDRAVAVRGRPVDDDRFNLELALTACRWLGRSVLPTG